MPYLVKHPELEASLIEVMQRKEFPAICKEYDTLLEQLGNVDGNEVISLAIIAIEKVNQA